MEVNRDRVIGKFPSEPHRTVHFGEGVRKIALLHTDVFWSEMVTTLTTPILGRAGKGKGGKREEDSENGGGAEHNSNEDRKMRVEVGSQLLARYRVEGGRGRRDSSTPPLYSGWRQSAYSNSPGMTWKYTYVGRQGGAPCVSCRTLRALIRPTQRDGEPQPIYRGLVGREGTGGVPCTEIYDALT